MLLLATTSGGGFVACQSGNVDDPISDWPHSSDVHGPISDWPHDSEGRGPISDWPDRPSGGDEEPPPDLGTEDDHAGEGAEPSMPSVSDPITVPALDAGLPATGAIDATPKADAGSPDAGTMQDSVAPDAGFGTPL
jgi:hypothetical protein